MKLKPISDRIVVEVIKEKMMTPGGLHLPDMSMPQARRGRVQATVVVKSVRSRFIRADVSIPARREDEHA